MMLGAAREISEPVRRAHDVAHDVVLNQNRQALASSASVRSSGGMAMNFAATCCGASMQYRPGVPDWMVLRTRPFAEWRVAARTCPSTT